MGLNSLLSKLLAKRGIDKVEDLSDEEKVTIDKFKAVLSGENLTLDSIKDFMRMQIRVIETKFAEADSKNDVYYKACLNVYLTMLKAMEAPERERESLERYLTQLIEE